MQNYGQQTGYQQPGAGQQHTAPPPPTYGGRVEDHTMTHVDEHLTQYP
jgi:hypothetical protein